MCSSYFSLFFFILCIQPLPHSLAHGRVVFYNVSCETETAQVLGDHGSCNNLLGVNTSCSLRLPSGRCSCALTASTSAGTSPQARLWIPIVPETGNISTALENQTTVVLASGETDDRCAKQLLPCLVKFEPLYCISLLCSCFVQGSIICSEADFSKNFSDLLFCLQRQKHQGQTIQNVLSLFELQLHRHLCSSLRATSPASNRRLSAE